MSKKLLLIFGVFALTFGIFANDSVEKAVIDFNENQFELESKKLIEKGDEILFETALAAILQVVTVVGILTMPVDIYPLHKGIKRKREGKRLKKRSAKYLEIRGGGASSIKQIEVTLRAVLTRTFQNQREKLTEEMMNELFQIINNYAATEAVIHKGVTFQKVFSGDYEQLAKYYVTQSIGLLQAKINQ